MVIVVTVVTYTTVMQLIPQFGTIPVCMVWLVGAVLMGVGVVYAKPTCGDTMLIPSRQLAEKTRTCKKCKINTEGCIITPLDSVALFAQQDAECQDKQAAEEAKQKSKTDAIHLREHQHVLAVGTKVFADPLASYNHKDNLLDIIAVLGLDHTGTITVLRECI